MDTCVRGLSSGLVRICKPADLGRGEIEAFVALVSAGGAVQADRLKDTLQLAEFVALLLIAKKIVGVGAIKSMRPTYVDRVSRKSGFELPCDVRELGYVAISSAFRSKGISKLIVRGLTNTFPPDLIPSAHGICNPVERVPRDSVRPLDTRINKNVYQQLCNRSIARVAQENGVNANQVFQ